LDSASFFLNFVSLGLRPCLQATAQVAQCRPPVIDKLFGTGAVHNVPVLAALRTNAGAILAANLVHRQREQNVLAQDIAQFDPWAVVKPNLALPVVDRDFMGQRLFRSRPVKQVEGPGEMIHKRFETTIALQLQIDCQLPTDSNFSERVLQQLGSAFGIKTAVLLDDIHPIIYFASRKILTETNFPEFELLDTEKQHTPPPHVPR
jgi:hypothetical protein